MSDLLPLVAFRRLRPDGVLAAVDDHFFRLNPLLDHPLKKKNDCRNEPESKLGLLPQGPHETAAFRDDSKLNIFSNKLARPVVTDSKKARISGPHQ